MISDSVKISVAMTTYNGERYVVKQIESILRQTRVPDEVIICDDGSTDNTVELIKSFIANHNLHNWEIVVNKPNLGWKANFYKAVSLVKGDIIFFSDQDDIWNEDKIEVMSTLMINNRMGALYANKYFIDTDDNLIRARQEKRSFTGKIYKIKLTPSFCGITTLGCCMCVNREVADIYMKLGFCEGDHDSQTARLAVLFSTLWYLDHPVIRYRIHCNNTSGISATASYGQSTRENRIADILLKEKWIEKIEMTLELDDKKQEMLKGCKSSLIKRYDYFHNKVSFFNLLLSLKYYLNISMLLGDVAYKYEFNKFLGKVMWKIKR